MQRHRTLLSLAALAAALLLRWLLDPVLGNSLPLVTLFGAVAAAVWLQGPRMAVLVAIAGYYGMVAMTLTMEGADPEEANPFRVSSR